MPSRAQIRDIARTMLKGLAGMHGLGDFDLKQQWLNAVQDFQDKRAALDQAEQDLTTVYDTATQDPGDAAEWTKNYNAVKSAQAKMDAVAGAVATVANYWNNTTTWIADQSHDNVIYDAANTGLQTVTGNPYDTIGTWLYNITHSSGLNGVRQGVAGYLRNNGALGALGLVPLVLPITLGTLAVIVGIAAAALASVAAYITYINTKKDRVQQLIDAGVAPADAMKQATAEAQATSGYSFGATISKTATLAVIGVAIVVLGPHLAKRMERR